MRLTQDAQVMPSIGRASLDWAVGGPWRDWAWACRHTPWEYTTARTDSAMACADRPVALDRPDDRRPVGPVPPRRDPTRGHRRGRVRLTTADAFSTAARASPRAARSRPETRRRPGRSATRAPRSRGRRDRVEPCWPAGTRRTVPVDLRDRPDWDRLVLAEVRGIPLGPTAELRRDRPADRRAGRGPRGRRRARPQPDHAAHPVPPGHRRRRHDRRVRRRRLGPPRGALARKRDAAPARGRHGGRPTPG